MQELNKEMLFDLKGWWYTACLNLMNLTRNTLSLLPG
jgi:hypothetical protein